MKRAKNIVFISHCILNQNTVVEPLARVKGPYYDIVEGIIKNGIGIHQMPCPEFRYLGLRREPMTKDEYDTKEFRVLCREISKDLLNVLKEYINNEYKIIGIIGINHSPTCSIEGRRGILMEELISTLKENNLEIPLLDVPTDYIDEENSKDFITKLDKFLEEGLKAQ